MKIKYTIEYHKQSKQWILWKNIEDEKSISCKGIFKGTKKECIEKKKQLEMEN